jgi:hypothetical protein
MVFYVLEALDDSFRSSARKINTLNLLTAHTPHYNFIYNGDTLSFSLKENSLCHVYTSLSDCLSFPCIPLSWTPNTNCKILQTGQSFATVS